MASVLAGERFDAGRAVARATDSLRRNFALLAGLAAALQLLPSIVSALLGGALVPTQGVATNPFGATAIFGWTGLLGLVGFLLYCVALGAMTHVVVVEADGERPAFKPAVVAGLSRALPMVGMFILMYFGISFAMFLLIVPGLILLTMWAVAVPVLVGEGAGVFASLGRSRALTKGARWPVFGLIVALMLVYLLSFGVAGLLAGGFDPVALGTALSGIGVAGIVYKLINIAVMVVATVLIAAIYLELRFVRDGDGPASLAAVFA